MHIFYVRICCYSQVNWRKENVIKIIRESTFTVLYCMGGKSMYKWIHIVQTCVVQVLTVLGF